MKFCLPETFPNKNITTIFYKVNQFWSFFSLSFLTFLCYNFFVEKIFMKLEKNLKIFYLLPNENETFEAVEAV